MIRFLPHAIGIVILAIIAQYFIDARIVTEKVITGLEKSKFESVAEVESFKEDLQARAYPGIEKSVKAKTQGMVIRKKMPLYNDFQGTEIIRDLVDGEKPTQYFTVVDGMLLVTTEKGETGYVRLCNFSGVVHNLYKKFATTPIYKLDDWKPFGYRFGVISITFLMLMACVMAVFNIVASADEGALMSYPIFATIFTAVLLLLNASIILYGILVYGGALNFGTVFTLRDFIASVGNGIAVIFIAVQLVFGAMFSWSLVEKITWSKFPAAKIVSICVIVPLILSVLFFLVGDLHYDGLQLTEYAPDYHEGDSWGTILGNNLPYFILGALFVGLMLYFIYLTISEYCNPLVLLYGTAFSVSCVVVAATLTTCVQGIAMASIGILLILLFSKGALWNKEFWANMVHTHDIVQRVGDEETVVGRGYQHKDRVSRGSGPEHKDYF